MEKRIAVSVLTDSYEQYVQTLETLGYRVNQSSLRNKLIEGLGYKGQMKVFFTKSSKSEGNSRTAPAAVYSRISDLYGDLTQHIQAGIPDESERAEVKKLHNGALISRLRKMPDETLAQISQELAESVHAQFVHRREISIEEFRELLNAYAAGQSIARTKLIKHLQQEFEARGIKMSFDSIEERFRSNTKVRTMPACAKEILADLGPDFRTGLVPIEEMVGEADPDEWLKSARGRLMFRSDSAMHKAIAEAADLKYDAVHKALSGPQKAQRIQIGIKACLDRWLELMDAGEPLPVNPDYRGVAVEKLRVLLPVLLRRFRSKEAAYRQIAKSVGIKAGSVRRYFQGNGKIAGVPLTLYECAARLANRLPNGKPQSYLKNETTREAAYRIAERARNVLEQWRQDSANYELEGEFKSLRLTLIATIKEQRGHMS